MKKKMVREETSAYTVYWVALVQVEAFKYTVYWMALVLVIEVIVWNLFNLSRMWLPTIFLDLVLAIAGYHDFKKEILEILENQKNEKDDEMSK